jgi:hypothetical protein
VPSYRPALARTGAVLAAAALAMASCLPAGAVTGARWPLVFQAHYGTTTIYNGLLGVAAAGKTSAWAVGGTDLSGATPGAPLAEQWSGTSWQAATLPSGLTGALGAVSAPSTTDAWAVSQLSGYVLQWNGTAWSVSRTWREPKLPRELTGVTAFSPTDVWVFGSPGAYPGLGTWHLSGSTWHKVTGLADAISSASALSPSNMWAIGSDATAPDDIILHYHGTTWQQVTSPALSGLTFTRILALSGHNIWVIGSVGGRPPQKLVHFDGSQWSTVPVTVPRSVDLVSMAPDGHGGVWFSGLGKSASWVVHRSAGGTWSSTKPAAGSASTVYQLARIPGTRSLWGAGTTAAATGADVAVWGHGPAT